MADSREEEDVENDDVVKRKRNTKSCAWEHFGLKTTEDGKPVEDGSAVCRYCKRTVIARNGNTSNLFSHLRTRHPAKYVVAVKAKKKADKFSEVSSSSTQSSIDKSFARMKKYDKKSKRWQKLTDTVSYYLAKDMVPLYSVEKPGFKELVSIFDKQYELPSRKYFSQVAIPSLYTNTRDKIAEEISHLGYYSATTDLWSSEGMKPYLSYTIHYIDNWEMKSRCLQTMFMPQDHTGENLADAMRSTLETWGLEEEKQICLTTDSGSNMVNAVSRLNWLRLSCFGHNLHLAITNSIKCDDRCSRALGLSRKIVSAFSMSWKKRRDLAKAQLDHDLPSHTLIADCPTRWGSVHKMVARILEQITAIRLVLSVDHKHSHLLPTWQDIEVLEVINDVLSPLVDLTDLLSGEQYVSVSSIKPVISHIHNDALAEKDDDVSLAKDLKRRIRTDLDSRYLNSDVQNLLNVTSFLDPRFKMENIAQEDRIAVKEKVIEEGLSVGEKDKILESDLSSASGNDLAINETEEEPPATKKSKLARILRSKNNDESRTISLKDKVEREVQCYIDTPYVDVEKDPLKWWAAECCNYPCMSQLAMKYLSVCATSSPSERVFSASGKIVTPLRNHLKPDMVDKLVFLSQNLK